LQGSTKITFCMILTKKYCFANVQKGS
jgi:hypothetical protein